MPLPDTLKLIFSLVFCITYYLIWWLSKDLVPYVMWKLGIKLTLLNIYAAKDLHIILIFVMLIVSLATSPLY